jgi:putative ABC transport system permease protein
VIFLLFALVVPLVTGLFFLIITLQKARALTLLRAIGAPGGVLVRSLLVQVLIVIGGGVALGTALYAPLSQATVGSLSLRFDAGAVLLWGGLLLGSRCASCAAGRGGSSSPPRS